LKESIARAEEIIRSAGLNENESVKAVIRAAHERASFDKVTRMPTGEFRDGLRRTRRYSDEALDQIVRDIVIRGNAARHEALIDVIEWSTTSVTDFMFMSVPSIPEGQEFWESFLMRTDKGSTFFGTGRLGTLAAQAEKGCAQALLARLEFLQETDG
jgi:hypothetical protein